MRYALILGGAHFRARDELAEVLVTGAGRGEEGKFEFSGFQIFDFRLQIGWGRCRVPGKSRSFASLRMTRF